MKRFIALLAIMFAIASCGADQRGSVCNESNGFCYYSDPGDPTPTPAIHFCAGSVLRVPQDCATIQQAVDAAGASETSIYLMPGTYRESVHVPTGSNIWISGYNTIDYRKAIVDGGSQSAFRTGDNVTLRLHTMTIQSAQSLRSYQDATVFMELGGSLFVANVVIRTSSIAVSTNYTHATRIDDSRIIGDGSAGSIGVELAHGNEPRDWDVGHHVEANSFENLGTAIYRCSGSELIDRGPNGLDSNEYTGVATLFRSLIDPC